MDRRKKIEYREWLYIIIAWVIIMNLFAWASLVNFRMYASNEDVNILFERNPMLRYMLSDYQFLEATLFGLIFGFLFVIVNHFLEKTELRKRSFGTIILLNTLFYSASLFAAGFFIYLIFELFDIYPDILDYDVVLGLLTPQNIFFLILYFSVLIYMMNFILEVRRKFGPGNLWRMMTGKYHLPKEEERIFLFIDLKDSTKHAEELGNNKYSQMLRSCYYDLTDIVIMYGAEIYQYVGDEVVLTWKRQEGIKNLNCVKAFFAFENKLEGRKEFYEKNFGVTPVFKAGMGMGTVTATEIGEIKREIAFHGDVLNTASRIQHQCNRLNQRLLISENIAESLKFNGEFSMMMVGELHLRGKRGISRLYSITYQKLKNK